MSFVKWRTSFLLVFAMVSFEWLTIALIWAANVLSRWHGTAWQVWLNLLCPLTNQILPPVYLNYSLAFYVLQPTWNPSISIGVAQLAGTAAFPLLDGSAQRGESDGCRPRFRKPISAEPSGLRTIFSWPRTWTESSSESIAKAMMVAPNNTLLTEETPLLSSNNECSERSTSSIIALSKDASSSGNLSSPGWQTENLSQPDDNIPLAAEAPSPAEKYVLISTIMPLILEHRQITIEKLRSLQELEREIYKDQDSHTTPDPSAIIEISVDRKEVIEEVCELHRLLCYAYKHSVTRRTVRRVLAILL